MDNMQGVWLENQVLSVRDDIPVPAPRKDEALIKVRLAGICSTDLEMVRGYYPFTGILGHEFVGEVVDAPGNVEWRGRRVVGEINMGCGQCRFCKSGLSIHCEQRATLGIKNCHGVFADYAILPLANLHEAPAGVPDEAAVFTEPLAAALEIQQQIHIHPSDSVLLIGAGRLGQLIAQTLMLTGCALRVAVRHSEHQRLLANLGIVTLIEEEIGIKQWDVVIDATGSAAGFDLARRAVRPRGTIVMKSTYAGDSQVNLSPLVVDEICLLGSRCGPFAPALRLLENNQVDTASLITARYPLSQAMAAFERAIKTGVLKVLLDPNAPPAEA